MDPVTHTLVGVGLANAFFRRRLGRETVPVLAIASNLPDIDAVVHLSLDPRALLLRRTFGHSLFLVPIWSYLLARLLVRTAPRLGRLRLFGLCLLGATVHLFFDLINSFGVVLLWPWSSRRPELAIVFIIDLTLTGLLAAPLLLALHRGLRDRLAGLSRAALLLVALYLLVCACARGQAARLMEAQVARSGSPADFVYLFPEPLGPQRWRGVARRGTVYDIELVRPFAGLIERRGRARTDVDDARVTAARASPLGRRLEGFFKAPVWTVCGTAGGADRAFVPATVTVHDLRFTSLVLARRTFGFGFAVGADGGVEYNPHASCDGADPHGAEATP